MKVRPVLLLLLLLVFRNGVTAQIQSLKGEWHYRLDSLDKGISEKWFTQTFEKAINLPGTLDDAGIGKPSNLSTDSLTKAVLMSLTRKHSSIGATWYQKEIIIPENWKKRVVEMSLERVIWQTRLWVDGKEMGKDESLSTAQTFSLGKLKPGKHRLVLRIDNRKQYDISYNDFAHAYTNGTQIIWNGVIGNMQLEAKPGAHFTDIKTYPDAEKKQILIAASTLNLSKKSIRSVLTYTVFYKGKKVAEKTSNLLLPTGKKALEMVLPLGPDAHLWDEFSPAVYDVKVLLQPAGKSISQNEIKTQFGLRKIGQQNGLLSLNGRRIFLRGTLECNIFPLTGHPPMEEKGWQKVFGTARAYGLNHIRFHSWCPPEAAFRVADSLGFYLQVELPLWGLKVGANDSTTAFLRNEAKRILDSYGNHPSFCFFSMGNELEGNYTLLNKLVDDLKSADDRRLYSNTTFTFQKGHGKAPEKNDDYFITQWTNNGWVRGQGIFNTEPPNFSTDYRLALKGIPVPVITHEIGQYSVYPNLKEIEKYTGVLDPLNFKAIKKDLQKKHMMERAGDYLTASGKHAANLYKEEIERALKTPGLSGFELLDLHDFPGQGTALVGILDAFWDSKGLVSADEHRKYCGPVVPLLRFKKAVYTSAETFVANAEVANFGDKALKGQTLEYVIRSGKNVLKSGTLNPPEIQVGNGVGLGDIDFPLKDIKEASALTLELSIKGTPYQNQWSVWVYPERLPEVKSNVHYTRSLDEALLMLKKGETVLLNPDTSRLAGVQGRYAPVFWSPVHFPDQPGTMGLLVDAKHPAFAGFPTENYSNWQWWDLVTHSKTMIVDHLPAESSVLPVVDNFFKNRKMAAIIEGRFGNGRLVICSMDMNENLDKRPAARQLKQSLLRYMQSEQFKPAHNFSGKEVQQLIR